MIVQSESQIYVRIVYDTDLVPLVNFHGSIHAHAEKKLIHFVVMGKCCMVLFCSHHIDWISLMSENYNDNHQTHSYSNPRFLSAIAQCRPSHTAIERH